MRVVVDPGRLSVNHLQTALARAVDVNLVALLTQRVEKKASYAAAFPEVPVCLVHDFLSPSNRRERIGLHSEYDRVLRSMLSDPRTTYLTERKFGVNSLKSVFNYTPSIEAGVWNCISFIGRVCPDKVVFQATPHHISTWLFGRVAELLGVSVFFSSHSIFPGRTEALSGIDDQVPIGSQLGKSAKISESVLSLVQMKSGAYDNAIPDYEKRRQKEYKDKFWRTRSEIKHWMGGKLRGLPFRILDSARKARVLKLYEKLTCHALPRSPFIAFFPHFQPERTTIPEGGWYAQQWLALSALSEAAKKHGWYVVYKEHPTTFRHRWNSTFRSAEFYDSVASLENVCLVPMSFSPFDLVDDSVAAATINGTVILESIVRGKPVLAFGNHVPRGLQGVHVVHSMADVDSALEKIANGQEMPDLEVTKRFLAEVESRTWKRDPKINTSVDAYVALLKAPCKKRFAFDGR